MEPGWRSPSCSAESARDPLAGGNAFGSLRSSASMAERERAARYRSASCCWRCCSASVVVGIPRPTGTACSDHRLPAPRCSVDQSKPIDPRRGLTPGVDCVDPKRLRVIAAAFPKRGAVWAVLGAGAPRGDEAIVRRGTVLGQFVEHTGQKIQVHWMVADIQREPVELSLDAPGEPSPDDERVRLPIRRLRPGSLPTRLFARDYCEMLRSPGSRPRPFSCA